MCTSLIFRAPELIISAAKSQSHASSSPLIFVEQTDRESRALNLRPSTLTTTGTV